MAFCTKCGAQVQGPFCGSCGAPAPGGGVQPPAAGAPPVTPPAPAAAGPPVGPATATKTSPIIWILGGCFGLLVIGGLATTLVLYYIGHKAKQVAHMMEKNPGYAVARIIAATQPDVEVLSTDEDKGTITVRDKKTGKVLTMNLADAQKGKFVFEQDGKRVAVEAHADGDKGSLELKSDEGSMKFNTGGGKLPDWLPAYAGAAPQGSMSMQNADGTSGGFHFTTKDSVEQVMSYYEDALKKAGLKVSTNVVQQNGKAGLGFVTAEDTASKRKAMVTVTAAPDGTTVSVNFSTP